MTEASFEWNGATITVRNDTLRVEILRRHLRTISGAFEEDADTLRSSEVITATHYLASTVKIEGNLGFDVPIGNPTSESINAFVDGLLDSDLGLAQEWDNTIDLANKGSNDPDLLPSDELDIAKKKTQKSQPNGKIKESG